MEHLFIPKQVAEHQTYPLVLLLDDSIQSADTANWIAGYADCYLLHDTEFERIETIMERVGKLFQTTKANPAKVYLLGIGAGADAAWRLAAQYSRSLAACAVIGGTGDPYAIRNAKFLPIRAFPGKPEFEGNGEKMIYSLRYVGSKTAVYEQVQEPLDESLLDWLFQQTKASQYEIHWLKPGLWNIESGTIETFFLVEGEKKALLIDTGMGDGPILPMIRTLTKLPVELAITHAHGDHMLHADEFERVYISPNEAELPRDFLQAMMPGKTFRPGCFVPVQEGDIIDLGGKQIEVFHAFGHTPGSIVFADHEDQCLFSGDAFGSGMGVLMAIPGIRPLSVYLDSLKHFLEKTSGLRDYLIYGGHWVQESAEQKEGGRYTPLCFEVLEDMIVLCEKLLGNDPDLTWTQQTGKWVTEPVYDVAYRSASMWVTKSAIR